MSKLSYRPRGGQKGIEVTNDEINKRSFILGKDDGDIVPLPKLSIKLQRQKLKECKKHFDNSIYWETETGSHGWCCSNCGLVTQYG